MSYKELAIASNVLNPATLSFCLGATARLARSELSIPKDVYAGISIFLLLSIGMKGGHELAQAPFLSLIGPVIATVLLGMMAPLMTYCAARSFSKLSVADCAGIAAHYGSVSVVTFIAAQTFVTQILSANSELPPLEGYMPTLVALLESPGIMVALSLGVLCGERKANRSTASLLHEVATGRTMFLLLGGLLVGAVMGTKNWETVAPFFDPKGGIFRGLLCLFLLEMGISAASRFHEVRRAGVFMVSFGILMPLVLAAMGIVLGHLAGLSVGGTAVLATMAASASYIAAPPAVRSTLPDANPAYYLTLALAITFPFNIIVGIPLYFQMSQWYFINM